MIKLISINSLLFAIVCAFGCKRTIDYPVTNTDAGLNFYNASTALLADNKTQWIYIDKNPDSTDVNQPYFSSNYLYHEFPRPDPVPVVLTTPQNPINTMRISEGDHAFAFTDGYKQTIARNSYELKNSNALCLYIADSAENYSLVPAYEPNISNPQKVRVRFINLSPNADSLNCTLQKSNGGAQTTGLPANFRYRDCSAYTELDTTGNLVRGNLQFTFTARTDTLSSSLIPPIYASVPAQPGKSYVVLLQGYRFAVAYTSKANGSSQNIPANVKVVVRTAY